ncbi:MAG TPA: alkaline phosphatase family protein [Bacteroidia bacterium]|nr:alkaline phosphatase family protein [Bacteroidia bacterium]
MAERIAKRVLLIGWDAADWKIINPLLESGQMPALQKLISRGVMGNIATLDPPLSPMLWTSISTGKTADKHGILGFVEPDPVTGKVRPSSVTSRKVKALWNILQQNGLRSHAVGWWPSHPAEPLDGVYVSNFFAKPNDAFDQPWPVAENSVHPGELAETLAECRVHPGEISFAHILPFVPDAHKVDQDKDKRLSGIATLLASGSTYHAVATWIMQNREWDFLAVYLNEIDLFSHTFMKFHPPQMAGMPDELFALYKDVLNGAYRFHDMMLERLMELAGDDTVIILTSDHGFHSENLRPKYLPTDPAAPAMEHAPYGVLCISGPGITPDERVYGATLLDIAPTVLTLFGLPVGKDMDGKALVQVLEKNVLPEFIESWENVSGNSGQHSSEVREDPWAAQQAMQQLVELGYVEALGEDDAESADKIRRESRFYLARVFISTNRLDEAIPVLEELHREVPDVIRFGLRLAFVYHQAGRTEDARKIIDELRAKQERENDLPPLDYLEGSLLFSEGRPLKALALLRRAEQGKSHMPGLHLLIGQIYTSTRNWADAERAFIRALSIDPDNARAHHGLAFAALRQDKIELAIDEALNAVGLKYQLPAAHYHLGEALYKYGDHEKAAQAFEVCVRMAPGNRRARMWLAKIYSEHLGENEKADAHIRFVKEFIRGTITVVSGLPRSGTSMMMQMLRAGGLDVISDEKREADESNPKGYFEDERVKKLHLDNSWLADAEGKVIKVVAPLLQFLPAGYNYRIIFMQREIGEVLKSQQKMLGKKDDKNYPTTLADAFSKQLEKAQAWMKAQPYVSFLEVNYRDVIADPLAKAEEIAAFTGENPDPLAMAEAVSGELYRNRKSNV